MRAGHISWKVERSGPPASLSSAVERSETRMNARQTARRAVITTGLAAAVGVAILTTPDFTTQLAAAALSIAASSLALLTLSRTPWLRSASPEQLGRRIWAVAGCTALVVWAFFWVPLVTKHPTVRSTVASRQVSPSILPVGSGAEAEELVGVADGQGYRIGCDVRHGGPRAAGDVA